MDSRLRGNDETASKPQINGLIQRPCLMLVTDRKQCRTPLEEIVEEATDSGAINIVQLREKDLSSKELLRLARSIRSAIGGQALLIVNGNAKVARDSGADGVHLPESGPPIEEARAILGKQALIGESVHDPSGAAIAEAAGADYVVLGTIFATASKPGLKPAGTDRIAQAHRAVRIPIIAIGGITPERAPEALRAGAAGIAVCSAILCAKDPFSASLELRSRMDASDIAISRFDKGGREPAHAS